MLEVYEKEKDLEINEVAAAPDAETLLETDSVARGDGGPAEMLEMLEVHEKEKSLEFSEPVAAPAAETLWATETVARGDGGTEEVFVIYEKEKSFEVSEAAAATAQRSGWRLGRSRGERSPARRLAAGVRAGSNSRM